MRVIQEKQVLLPSPLNWPSTPPRLENSLMVCWTSHRPLPHQPLPLCLPQHQDPWHLAQQRQSRSPTSPCLMFDSHRPRHSESTAPTLSTAVAILSLSMWVSCNPVWPKLCNYEIFLNFMMQYDEARDMGSSRMFFQSNESTPSTMCQVFNITYRAGIQLLWIWDRSNHAWWTVSKLRQS